MTARIGMDSSVVRGLADQLDRIGDDLANLIGRVNGSVNRLGGTWHGADFHELAHIWRSRDAPAITRVHDELHQMATAARQNVAEQERASRADVDSAGWTAERIESVAIDGAGLGLTLGSLSIGAVEAEKLSKELGVPLKDLQVGELGVLDTASTLATVGHYFDVANVGIDVAKFGIDVHDGANPWATTYDVAHGVVDVIALDNPYVAAGAGAWDVGTTIGTAIANSPANQHVEDQALNVGASHIAGDPYTDPKAAEDLVDRYKGVHGFFNAAGDYFHAF